MYLNQRAAVENLGDLNVIRVCVAAAELDLAGNDGPGGFENGAAAVKNDALPRDQEAAAASPTRRFSRGDRSWLAAILGSNVLYCWCFRMAPP